MFTHLLNALFGARKPSDRAIEALPQWDDWLLPIRADAPVGDYPGYDDDFLAIKDEVAKLSNVDDALIIDAAEWLIKSRAKDVRLAVYYVYGRLRREGAEGLAAGFEMLAALVERFDDTLLPARAGSRRAAFEWLCGSTFADRLDAVQGFNGPLLERALSALALITDRIESWPEDARPVLAPLFGRFEGRIESPSDNDATSTSSNTASERSAPTRRCICSAHSMQTSNVSRSTAGSRHWRSKRNTICCAFPRAVSTARMPTKWCRRRIDSLTADLTTIDAARAVALT
nr:type VI secretion system ImpA family N-terminal domain-containing protein [Caballeronia sp. ATUFL_F1_KS4A]